MATTDSGVSTILQLPNVIWQLIINHIPQKDLVQHRLVSKKWRDNIDELATFHIDFFDHLKPAILDRIFRLRIRCCSFHRLKECFEPQFEYPLLVKDITLSNVSSENLIKILSTCRYVEKLRFFSTLGTDKQFKPDKDYSKVLQLRKLKELDVGIHTIGTRSLNSQSSIFDTLFVKNVNVLHFDVLEKLNVCFSMKAEEWIQLFGFIARHARTLKSLELRCMCGENGCNRSDFSEVNQIELMKRLNLHSLIIRCDSVSPFSTLHEVFNTVVSMQKSLEVVSLRYAGLMFPLLVNLLGNCKTTVKSVRFQGAELGFGELCDGSILTDCAVLKELVLDFLEKTYIVVPVDFGERDDFICKPECTVVSEFSLPRSLATLKWEGLWIKTSELMRMCESSDCPTELTKLELCNVGLNEEFGVTTTSFVRLCTKFSELEFLKVGKLNLNGEDEIEKWKHIVQSAITLGIYENKLDHENKEIFSIFRFSGNARNVVRAAFLNAITNE